jgi:hypothetical protein
LNLELDAEKVEKFEIRPLGSHLPRNFVYLPEFISRNNQLATFLDCIRISSCQKGFIETGVRKKQEIKVNLKNLWHKNDFL